MGREARQTAEFTLMGKPVRMYRLTNGQGAALAVAREKGGTFMVSRLWAVLEHLFVDRADWDRFDQGLVSGEMSLEDALTLLNQLSTYDWDAELVKAASAPDGIEG